MVVRKRFLLSLVPALGMILSGAACSSTDQPAPSGNGTGGGGGQQLAPPAGTGGDGGEQPSPTSCVPDAYPSGPNGTSVGSVLTNLDLVGRVSFDAAAAPAGGFDWKNVSLDDVRKSCKKYALIFLPAYWCTPCRPNAEALAAEAQAVNDKGGLLVEILVDGTPPDTAPTKAMVDNWVKLTSVNFTTVIDPPDKPLRTKTLLGWDSALVLELATMKIIYKGNAKSALDVLKQKLGP